MNQRYNKVVDLFINHLIDNYEIISNDCYTCTFNDEYETVLWLGNYPYAYGTLYSTKLLVASQGRPSRMTVQRLSVKVDEYINKVGKSSDWTVEINGKAVDLALYNVNGYNYVDEEALNKVLS